MIVKIMHRGKPRFLLVTSGRTYTHRTLAAAKAQESAINIAKARRAGHRIPRPAP